MTQIRVKVISAITRAGKIVPPGALLTVSKNEAVNLYGREKVEPVEIISPDDEDDEDEQPAASAAANTAARGRNTRRGNA